MRFKTPCYKRKRLRILKYIINFALAFQTNQLTSNIYNRITYIEIYN